MGAGAPSHAVLGTAVVSDMLDRHARVEGAIDLPEAVAEVPVDRVQDAHGWLNDGGLRPVGQRRLGLTIARPTREW